jgi:superfamily II DNA or RNA helicase
LFFPRGFGNQAVRLCRRETGRSPEIVDTRRLLPPIVLSFTGVLRDYQEAAVAAVLDHSFGVLEAGTGSGKTIMALAVIARRNQPTLIIVHSKELMQQWRIRIEQFLGLKAGMAGDGLFDIQPVTVAIVNTAKKHLDTLPSQFGQIVVDECHRVPASLFTDVVAAFDCQYMLGLSATAFRREDGMTRLISIYMGDRVHTVDGRMLAASGAVVRPVLEQRPTTFAYGYQGEYAKLIKALAANEQRNRQIVGDMLILIRQGHQGTILVVSDRVAHCQALADLLTVQGMSAPVLTGQSPPDERAKIVKDVQSGQLVILIATLQLIGEGFDCPGLSTLVLATPIKFEGRLLQVVGRIMRPAEGKQARVIDYVDEHIPVLRRSAAARRAVFANW